VLELFEGFEPTETEDRDVKDFSEPIRGKYEAVIEGIEYKDIKCKDGSEREIIQMKLKIINDVSGDFSMKRKVDKAYFMGTSEWNEDPIAGYKNLLNDLASSGLYSEDMKTGDIRGAVKEMGTTLIGQQVFLNMFPKSDKQQVRIVKPLSKKAPEAKVASKFQV